MTAGLVYAALMAFAMLVVYLLGRKDERAKRDKNAQNAIKKAMEKDSLIDEYYAGKPSLDYVRGKAELLNKNPASPLSATAGSYPAKRFKREDLPRRKRRKNG